MLIEWGEVDIDRSAGEGEPDTHLGLIAVTPCVVRNKSHVHFTVGLTYFAIETAFPALAVGYASLSLESFHLATVNSYILECELCVGRNKYIVKGYIAVDVDILEAVHQGTALYGSVVAGLLNKRVGLDEACLHLHVEGDYVATSTHGQR